jgi:hypothetical protein
VATGVATGVVLFFCDSENSVVTMGGFRPWRANARFLRWRLQQQQPIISTKRRSKPPPPAAIPMIVLGDKVKGLVLLFEVDSVVDSTVLLADIYFVTVSGPLVALVGPGVAP